jgi:hypothetical protein
LAKVPGACQHARQSELASLEFSHRPVAGIRHQRLAQGVIIPRRLSEEEFSACFAQPMSDVTAYADAAVDIWPYVDGLDLDELGMPSINDVHYVYRDARGRFDQVLIGTGRFNALLVIVVDLGAGAVFGHFLLDLNKEYGVSGGHLNIVR